MSQARLALTIAQGTTLVTVDTARAVLGMDADSVAGLCESGALAYAFDLRSASADRREIRIWAQSIESYVRGTQVEGSDWDAIESIVGHHTADWIACSRLAQRFVVSRRSIDRWVREGSLYGVVTGHTLQIRRSTVVPFLTSRRIR